MLVLMLHSAEHCNFVRMGEYYVSCSSDISRVRESFRMTVHLMLIAMSEARFVHHMSVLPAELSRYHAHATEIVTRQNRGIAPKTHENSRHDRFQYTVMLLVISAARFVHYMSVLLFELSRYHSLNGNIIENAGETSCTCEAHGGADRSSRRDLPRRCKDIRALICCRTDRARSDAPAST